MVGLKIIKEIAEAVLMWKDKGNEVIKRLNIPWKATLPDDQFGEIIIRYGDNQITIDASQLKTFDFVACDENGVMKTYTTFGFEKPEEDPD